MRALELPRADVTSLDLISNHTATFPFCLFPHTGRRTSSPSLTADQMTYGPHAKALSPLIRRRCEFSHQRQISPLCRC
ncbi:hypothetical protein PoB_004802300 [Plakobranchus ocellatus]|uniref:Uncharacterized protein n=1 Tax=Plakobranchus ocellatus TaxID=259542 RepID=A0AAV4BPL5_9GAST|nr:hypothetical protein PoB_004802300 [Plakobranchus ocellatus]